MHGLVIPDWANGGYVDGLLSGVVSWCWCKFFGKLVLFQKMCMLLRDKNMLQLFGSCLTISQTCLPCPPSR